MRRQRQPDRHHDRRQDQPDGSDGTLDPQPRDQQRREHRPDGEPDQPDAFEGAQHAGEHPVSGDALQDRAPHHVGCREPDAADRYQGQGEAGRRAEPDQRDRPAPRDGRQAERRSHAPAADEGHAGGAAEHGAEAQAGIEEPCAGLAGHEDLLGEQHEQHVHRPRDDHADGQEADDEASVGARRECPQSADHQRGDRLRVSVILAGRLVTQRGRPGRHGAGLGRLDRRPAPLEEAAHVHHEHDGQGRCQRAERPYRSGPGNHQERRCRQRSEEHPGALDGARHAVRGRELLRGPREPRQQGALGGARERGAGRLHRCRDVDEDRRDARQHAGRRDRIGDRLHDVAREQHALAGVAIRERRGEGGDDGRWEQHRQGDDAHRVGPRRLVCVDEDRDVAPEEGGAEQQVGQLDPPQRGVPQHRPHDPEGDGEMPAGTRDPAHRADGSA